MLKCPHHRMLNVGLPNLNMDFAGHALPVHWKVGFCSCLAFPKQLLITLVYQTLTQKKSDIKVDVNPKKNVLFLISYCRV